MVRHTGVSVHHGLRDWLVQRVSAVIMVMYTLPVIAILLFHSPLQYADWTALFSSQWMRVASLLFLLSLFIHAWIGMHDILLDYVHAGGIKRALQAAVIFALAAYSVWSIQILWGV